MEIPIKCSVCAEPHPGGPDGSWCPVKEKIESLAEDNRAILERLSERVLGPITEIYCESCGSAIGRYQDAQGSLIKDHLNEAHNK